MRESIKFRKKRPFFLGFFSGLFLPEHAKQDEVETEVQERAIGLPVSFKARHEGMKSMQMESESTMVMACPSGHRVRGGIELAGQTVRCPKCRAQFVFAPRPATPSAGGDPNEVTDTGVMRILGDMEVSPKPEASPEVAHRPCSRCGVAIPETLSVCSHCNCYVGVMPTFMKQITGNSTQSQ